MLHSHPSNPAVGDFWEQNLWQHKPTGRALIGNFETQNPDHDAIDLSPRGDCLLMAARGHASPTFKLYFQQGNKWILGAEIGTAVACGYPDATPQAHGTWSSCGSLYVLVMVSTW